MSVAALAPLAMQKPTPAGVSAVEDSCVYADAHASDWQVDVAFQLDDGQVIVEVWLEGIGPFRMNVDTGVHPSVVDEQLVAQIGLEATGAGGYVAGVGDGEVRYRSATVSALTIGGHELANLPVIIARTRHLELSGGPIDGTLGDSFFRQRAVQIDYPRRRLRLAPAGSVAPLGPITQPTTARRKCARHVLAADFGGLVPRLEDVLIGDQAVDAWLDTGSSSGLVLSRRTLSSLGLGQLEAGGRRVRAAGTRGSFEGVLLVIPSVSLGSLARNEVPTLLAPIGGIWVGNGVLHDLVLTLDYSSEIAVVEEPRELRL